MNKGILELASYLNISDEEITISYNGTDISSTLGLSYYLPYNKVYTMENITGSFTSYTYIKKQTDNKLYLSSNLTDWYLIGIDGVITTSGGCTILVRTFDFIDSNLKTNGINTLSNEYPNINSSITVTGNYTTTSNIKTVNVNASTATITLDNIFITNSITIRKISAYDGNAVTISPPSGATIEGRASVTIYGQYSFVEIERISATVFAIREWKDKYPVTPVLAFDGTSVGITYSVRSCIVTRNGHDGSFVGRITLSSKGTSVGQARISGLPRSGLASGINTVCSIFLGNITYTGQYFGALTPEGVIGLYHTTEAAVEGALNNTNFTDGAYIAFQGNFID